MQGRAHYEVLTAIIDAEDPNDPFHAIILLAIPKFQK